MSPPVIDGGWGWVVCFACFIVHVLIDGMQYSSGIIFVTLLDYFHESKGNTSIVASLAPSICFVIGPFVAVLVNRFGCRTVAIAGGIVASISQFVSVFAPSLQFLYFSLGVMTGIGYGLIFLPSIVAVNHFFSDKKRSMAIGLAVSGTGFGTFIFGPVINLLIEAYAWQGAILILSGLVLNTVACGLVYHDPVPTDDDQTSANKEYAQQYGTLPLLASNSYRLDNKDILNEREYTNTVNNDYKDNDDLHVKELINAKGSLIRTNNDKRAYGSTANDSAIMVDGEESPFKHLNRRKPKEYEPCQENSICKKVLRLCKRTKETLKHARVFMLMRNIRFATFAVHSFLYGLGFLVPFVYLPDMAIEAGVDKAKAAWLVSCLGITNIIGRVFFGYLAGLSWVNDLYLYNTAVVICGLAMSVGPLLKAFWALMVYAGVVGYFSGVAISLTSIVCIKLVGNEFLPDALGISLFFDGLAASVGPPIAGWMYDVSGSYLYSYIFAGLSIALSGFIMFAVPLCCGVTKQSPTDAASKGEKTKLLGEINEDSD